MSLKCRFLWPRTICFINLLQEIKENSNSLTVPINKKPEILLNTNIQKMKKLI